MFFHVSLLLYYNQRLASLAHSILHHVAHVGTHHGLHHLSCALELLEKLVHLRKRCTRSVCDSLAAATVKTLRMITLIWSHREDNSLDTLE